MGSVSVNIKAYLVLICLVVFSVTSVSIAFDNDAQSIFLNRSVCKIKNSASPFSKTKTEKLFHIVLNRPDCLQESRAEGIVCIQCRALDIPAFLESFFDRAPPDPA